MGRECDAVENGEGGEGGESGRRAAGGSNSCPIGIRWLMSGEERR
jgi:hypothetical protein